jgi:hypothetical protein
VVVSTGVLGQHFGHSRVCEWGFEKRKGKHVDRSAVLKRTSTSEVCSLCAWVADSKGCSECARLDSRLQEYSMHHEVPHGLPSSLWADLLPPCGDSVQVTPPRPSQGEDATL